VRGLPGVQFALPAAVEQLRAVAADGQDQVERWAREQPLVLNSCDPANLYGPLAPGRLLGGAETLLDAAGGPLTFARVPSTWLVQLSGLPVLVAEDTGARMSSLQGADPDVLIPALLALLGHLSGFSTRVTTAVWNGEPILESDGRALLEAVGYYRDGSALSWDG
jgi:hypothetical protein